MKGHPLLVLLACLLLVSSSQAVRKGDEKYANELDGLFYVFADEAIHLIDPSTQEIVANITNDNDGNPLVNSLGQPRQWADAVYIENAAKYQYYVFVNEGDVYTDANGTEFSYTTVIDTVQKEIVARVRVGARPVHLYAVVALNEIWTHPDAEGEFDVISIDRAGDLAAANVKAFLELAGHGKLLVDRRLYPYAYATNVNDPHIFKINLENKTLVAAYEYQSELPDTDSCTGTHSIGYSEMNQHLYIECVDGSGIMEWNTVSNSVVHHFTNITGSVYSSLDAQSLYVVITDTFKNLAAVLQPDADSETSSTKYVLNVPGNPTSPVFYSVTDDENATWAELDIFWPLLLNTNKANLAAVAALKNASLSVTNETYWSEPYDCEYAAPTGNGNEHGGGDDSPALSLATSNGAAITPDCGACAASSSPSDFAYNRSGISYIDVADLLQIATKTTADDAKLIPAGALTPTPCGGNSSNACSYCSADNRNAKQGGIYIAMLTDIPMTSVALVNAATKTNAAFVATASNPAVITWAPTRTSEGRKPVDPSISPAEAPAPVTSEPTAKPQSNAASPAPAPAASPLNNAAPAMQAHILPAALAAAAGVCLLLLV